MTNIKAIRCSVFAAGLLICIQSTTARPAAAAPDTGLTGLAQSAAGSAHQHQEDHAAMTFPIPESMQREHEELHADLARLTGAGGRTGDAAREVAAVLHQHFVKENDYALPPLSLLIRLSQGKFDCGMMDVLRLTDKLEADMPAMLAEHKDIVATLQKLKAAAQAEGKPEGVRFAEMLAAHARTEEEVTYPTALLIGRYVKAMAAQCKR